MFLHSPFLSWIPSPEAPERAFRPKARSRADVSHVEIRDSVTLSVAPILRPTAEIQSITCFTNQRLFLAYLESK